MGDSTRIERDTTGKMEAPADALCSAGTLPGVLNAPVSGTRSIST